MSDPSYDTCPSQNWQEAEGSWEQWRSVLEPLLPEQWREQASRLGAWQRARKVKTPADLLRGLLLYAACSCSFRLLGIWATVQGLGSLSERAWRKRLVSSAAWIEWVLAALLRERIGMPALTGVQGRVLLVDATHLAVLAGHGDDLKLHCSYEVQQAVLEQVHVTDRKEAEHLSHLSLQAGDIAVTDAGYVAARSVETVQGQQAWVVQRFSARHVRLLDEAGEVIVLKARIEQQEYGECSQHQFWLLLPTSKQRVPVRVIALRLPKAQAEQAMARKAKRLRKQYGRKYSHEAVWWAQWCLLLTTLPGQDWSAPQLLDLYRVRWQIEVLFKRFKQSQALHRLPFCDVARARIVVHLHLLVWVLQEQLATQLQAGWEDEWWLEDERTEPETAHPEDPQEPSWPDLLASRPTSVGNATNTLLLMQVCLTQVQQIVRGSCSLWRLQAAWPSLQRYWGTRRRRRNQGPAISAWVSKRLVESATP